MSDELRGTALDVGRLAHDRDPGIDRQHQPPRVAVGTGADHRRLEPCTTRIGSDVADAKADRGARSGGVECEIRDRREPHGTVSQFMGDMVISADPDVLDDEERCDRQRDDEARRVEGAIGHDDDLDRGRRLIGCLLLGNEVMLQALQDSVELAPKQ